MKKDRDDFSDNMNGDEYVDMDDDDGGDVDDYGDYDEEDESPKKSNNGKSTTKRSNKI
jgi:hypothetical protein